MSRPPASPVDDSAELLSGASSIASLRGLSPPPALASRARIALAEAPKLPEIPPGVIDRLLREKPDALEALKPLERPTLDRCASFHLDTLATLASPPFKVRAS